MYKQTLGLLMLLCLLGATNIHAQNEKIKTLFILNFIKNVNWHSDIQTKSFKVLILGNKQISNELNSIGLMKSSGLGSLNVAYAKEFTPDNNIDIIVVSKESDGIWEQIKTAYQGKPVLIISDNCNGGKKVAGINIIDNGGKLSYEISKKNIESHNLNATPKLLNLGKQID
ncbi:YfiR family protein [Plebeiibacterium marinum]|uniref:YfiR family protein n=1 Tax=Plebeiibacterium marinum TaxID=2992111 RepID=A0AAE3MCW5_9BACT|nr:YfiR family protein [Plebeiobacterium marinum]MCW3805453.1 YfiR family protein [Plebeiobacterium marinum]